MRLLGLALFFCLLITGQAHAKREQAYSYSFTRVWNTAVRLLRIDFGSAITEKDKESGYFLFEYTDGGKQHAGSLELIRQQESGPESVRVVLQIPALPAYVEQNLLDRLGRKLTAEYGAPVTGKPSKPEQGGGNKPEQGGADGGGQAPGAKPGATPEPRDKASGNGESPDKPGR